MTTIFSYVVARDCGYAQNPAAFHFYITAIHTREICEKFVRDLKNSINNVIVNPKKELDGTLAVYGSSTGLQKTMFLGEIVNNFIQLLTRKDISMKYS